MNIQINNKSNYLPLLVERSDSISIAYYCGKEITQKIFLTHVEQLRSKLPNHHYNINLCEDRYHFLVLFTACASLEQVSLLPSSRVTHEIERIQNTYSDSYIIDEKVIEDICMNTDTSDTAVVNNYQLNSDKEVVIVFTSGSTGTPDANPKNWKQLTESAKGVSTRFGFNKSQQHTIIATVPPQHLFGFETTILYPLILGVSIHAGRPFYPIDIQQAIASTKGPHVLVTTPIHLKACASVLQDWPEIEFVISATATLYENIAKKAEQVLQTRVHEIYGCSEAGSIATRQMTKSVEWQLLDNYKIINELDNFLLSTPANNELIKIPDQLEVISDNYFKLIGRSSDLINIGGKRGSLANLGLLLKSISGVKDGVFFLPDEQAEKRLRLVAIVVTDGIELKKIRQELLPLIDSVFLPRPIIQVEQLPYNNLGKLTRSDLEALITEHNK